MTKSELIAKLAGSYPLLVCEDAEFEVNAILKIHAAATAGHVIS